MSTTVISTSFPAKAPGWAQTMRRWTDYLVKDFGGGPRQWKFAWAINFQKTGTFPIHPNYLGEMMIYGSFALMVWHCLPFVVLAWVWGGLFAVNIRLKEASMSRCPDWEQYKRHTWLLLPLII